VVFLGLACSIFVAVKIKRKVEEINREAELREQGVTQAAVEETKKAK
jgi:hypothetical protein